MKIGEVSKATGISCSAIRFYERQGLIDTDKVARAANGYRVYGEKELEDLRLIVKLKEFGLELNEIKNLLCDKTKSCEDLVASLSVQLNKFKEMERLIAERIQLLTRAKESCKSKCGPKAVLRNCRAS